MSLPPPEAVIFDWGGTLTPWHTIDPIEPWLAYTAVCAPERARELAEQIRARENARWTAQRTSAGQHGTGPLLELLAECGVDTDSTAHLAGMAAYLRWWDPHTLADPDAAPLLLALRERGLRVGVLSNTQWPAGHHDAVLARDGLLALIDGAVYSSELPVGKPHADAFRAALDAVGVADASRAVFVGDRPYDDVHGAQVMGMRAILLRHGMLDPAELVDIDTQPDAVVDRLGDVLAVVDGWLSP
jgi:putative hydrolase of the HAD superfamily